MRLVDLSMPIWEGAGYGEILAMPNCSVQFYEYMFYDVNGIRMTHLKIDDESGSPFMTPYQGSPHRRGPLREGNIYTWRLDEVPLERLILRDTVVLDVPGEDQHVITAEEIDAAVAQADYREGDDVLVRTSWATTEKAFELGKDYCVYSPSWSYEACLRMAEIMEEKKSGVFMTDAALIMTPAYQGYAWSIGDERIVPRPKSWPSAEARERLMDLPPGVFSPAPPSIGLGGYRDLVIKTIAICKCLVNANQLTSNRVKMIILPMLIKEGGASPCRFIAVEE
jgi:kynurenine formamidase